MGIRHLVLEPLEARELLSVNLSTISNYSMPSTKDLYVPLTGTDVGQTISYSASSSDPTNVALTVLTGNPTLQLTVAGTGSAGAFSGTMTFELFGNIVPTAVSEIESLVESGFYTTSPASSSFYRIIPNPGGAIQGGVDGTATSSTFNDDYNSQLAFDSPGILAWANTGAANSNSSEFFITDPNNPLSEQPQYWDGNYTILGAITSGQNIYQDIFTATAGSSFGSAGGYHPADPITITGATILSPDTQNGLLQVSVPNTYTGSPTITVTASATDGTQTQQSFTVSAAPTAVATDIDPVVVAPVANTMYTQEGTPIEFSVSGVDFTSANTLTFSVTSGTTWGATPTNVAVQVSSTGTDTATVTLTPTTSFTGNIALTLNADDSSANTKDYENFTLDVQAAPTQLAFTTPPPASVTAGSPFDVKVAAEDSSGNPVNSFTGLIQLKNGNDLLASGTATDGIVDFPTVSLASTGTYDLEAVALGGSLTQTSSMITVAAGAATQFVVLAPSTVAAGSSFQVTVEAEDAHNNISLGYTGTVKFSSTDSTATLPSNATLTDGVGTFNVTLDKTGSSVTATDTTTSSITGSASPSVVAGAATKFAVTAPATVTTGTSFAFTVTAEDAFNNVATSFTDQVSFTSDDGSAALPGDSSLTSGVGTFSATLSTKGTDTLTATDTNTSAISGTDTIAVSAPTAPQSTLSIASIGSQSADSGKYLFVPVNGTDSTGQTVTYTAASSNSSVTATVLSAAQTLELGVSGTTSSGAPFSGTMTFALFNTLTPNTVSTIENLVNTGAYSAGTFYRILSDLAIQGGEGNGSTAPSFDDEYNPLLAFNSPGLLVMANTGEPNSNSSEFFVTDTNLTPSTEPQYWNYNYTIFGQITNGQSIYQDIINTPLGASSGAAGGNTPASTISFTSAKIIDDTQDAVLQILEPANFNGSSTITVTGTAADGAKATQSFSASVAPPTTATQNNPIFLSPIGNQTTTENTPSVFTVAATDVTPSDSLAFNIYANGSGANFGTSIPASDGTFAIGAPTQTSTGETVQVTFTPASGFTGTIQLMAGVVDNQSSLKPADYQTFSLTVNTPGPTPSAPTVSLDSKSGSGSSGNYYTTSSTPTIDIAAQSGETVQIEMNGQVISTATATSSNSGQYTAVLPAGSLVVGSNTLEAVVGTGSNTASSPLTLIYAPSDQSVYTVPGALGSAQTLAFNFINRSALFNDSIGAYVVNDAAGDVTGPGGTTLAPGSAGYAQAALSSSNVIFFSGDAGGFTSSMKVTGGEELAFFLVQNSTVSKVLEFNPTNYAKGDLPRGGVVFFSITGANPDNFDHVQVVSNPTNGQVQLNWKDEYDGGDLDFNDVVMTITPSTTTATNFDALQVNGATGQSQSLVFGLDGGSDTTTNGDVGYFVTQDAQGDVKGSNGALIAPGQAGYLAAALASTNATTIFAAGAAQGTTNTLTISAGTNIGFYAISNGTASNLLSVNPTNSSSNSTQAFLSFGAANPTSQSHFRWFGPDGVAEPSNSAANEVYLHVMDQIFGNNSNFDDLLIGITPSS